MGSSADEAAQQLLTTLPLIIRLMNDVLQREQPNALTVPQLRALEQLAEGPLTTTELARRRRVALASMGELVQALVERGLVVRQPNPADRRQQLLLLTDEGRQRHERAFALLRERLVATLSSGASAGELAAMCLALPALRRSLEATLATQEGV